MFRTYSAQHHIFTNFQRLRNKSKLFHQDIIIAKAILRTNFLLKLLKSIERFTYILVGEGMEKLLNNIFISITATNNILEHHILYIIVYSIVFFK